MWVGYYFRIEEQNDGIVAEPCSLAAYG